MLNSRRAALVALALVVVGSSCSSKDNTAAPATTDTTTTSTVPPIERPAGPAADVSKEITGTKEAFLANGDPDSAKAPGYEQHEYLATGTATSYALDGAQGADGRWAFKPDANADYRTRIVVRRPSDPAKFSGTVVLEWLNVSGGADADVEWTSTHEEVTRQGHIWVGVSAQQVGVLGGPVLVKAPGGEGIAGVGLKQLDPERYGSLVHPGDGFSFDMYTQVARALRAGGDPLGGSTPTRIIAVGESQSAFALTTYVNGVQPLTKAFDGFLIHSRGSTGLPLVAPGATADLAAAITAGSPTILRADLGVPVLDVQTESDVLAPLNSYPARQPDTDTFRLWEVAGTAHADAHTLGAAVANINCGAPVNNGPMHLVVKAALRALDRWTRTGETPPIAPRLDVTTGAAPEIARTPDGLATGGIRTPPVDVPVADLSGAPGPSPDLICILLGSTKPFDAARLAALYPTRSVYDDAYRAATDRAIAAGFVLEDDRAALMGYASPPV